MTTNIFLVILIIGSVLIFSTVSILMMVLLNDDDVGFGIGTVATALFVIFFTILTPSDEQMIENDYYAMLEDRPKCIDADDVSLGCKKDYVDWQKDSIKEQRKYDSVRVVLENAAVKHVTVVPKAEPDTSVSDTLKTCIEQCWKFAHMDKGLQECYAWYNTVWLKSYLNARTRKPVADSLRQARIEELEDELSRLTGIDYRDVRIRR